MKTDILEMISEGDTILLDNGREVTFKERTGDYTFRVFENDSIFHIDSIRQVIRKSHRESTDEPVGGTITLNIFEDDGRLGIGIERKCVSNTATDLKIIDALITALLHEFDWSNPRHVLTFGAIMALGDLPYED